jgi:hypothetical protein
VPVDAFWSISLYNAVGYFQANDRDAYSIITAVADDDGTITAHFGGCSDDRPNCLPIMDVGTTSSVSAVRGPKCSTPPGPFRASNETDSHQASARAPIARTGRTPLG